MRISLLICALAIIGTAFAAEEEDGVLVLDESNFDETVNNAELILVEFYAPWCGHCKKLAPEYAAAAQELKKLSIPLAKVDCDSHKELANRFGITGFPTLKVFRKGVPSDYTGPRQRDGIVRYMEKQSGPSAKPVTAGEDLKRFLAHHDVSILGFFQAETGSLRENFRKTADKLREEFRFAEVTDKELLKEYGHETGDAIVMFTHEKDAAQKVFSGGDSDSLTDWIYASCLPLVGEFNTNTDARYRKRAVPILKLWFDVDFGTNVKRTNYWINRLKKVAEGEAAKKLSFTFAKKGHYKDELSKFGFGEVKDVALGIDDINANLRYKYEGEVTVDSIKKFVQDFLDKKLVPYIKSEPIPEANNEAVKVVVGNTFNDIVMDPTKNVMIEMYAPWCGHCKNLEPIYKSLAEKIQNEKISNVVIAKMDATANDSPHPKVQARGYPTIFFLPADKKGEPIQYNGEREVKAMYDWIKKNSSSWKKDEL